jgi:hypothetical protein
VYAFLLAWPKNTTTVTLGDPIASTGSTVINLLGYDQGALPWRAASRTSGIVIDLSSIRANALKNKWAWTFKMSSID